jgi:hypothetical protein
MFSSATGSSAGALITFMGERVPEGLSAGWGRVWRKIMAAMSTATTMSV